MIKHLLTNIKRKTTLVEAVIVIGMILVAVLYSLNLMTKHEYGNPPLMFHIGRNFVRAEIICEETNGYCNDMKFCDLNFGTGFIESIDSDSIKKVNGEFDIGNIKYITKNEDGKDKCYSKYYRGYNMKKLYDSIMENTGEPYVYIINGVLYDKDFNRINGVRDSNSGIIILDGIMYF